MKLPAGAQALTANDVAVLNAVDELYRTRRRVTVRDVADAVDRAPSNTYNRLWRLRSLGLVTWESGVAATLRPTVDRVDVDRSATA